MVSEITVYIIESGGWSGATNGLGIGFELDWDFANPSGSRGIHSGFYEPSLIKYT